MKVTIEVCPGDKISAVRVQSGPEDGPAPLLHSLGDAVGGLIKATLYEFPEALRPMAIDLLSSTMSRFIPAFFAEIRDEGLGVVDVQRETVKEGEKCED